MFNPGTLAVLLIFGFPFLIVGGFFLVWAMRIYKGGADEQGEQTRSQETKLIQEIHQGLIRMEERIEALEIIILDPDRKDDS
jgi:phage shock protein B